MTDLLSAALASLQQAPAGVSSLSYPVPNLPQPRMHLGAPQALAQPSTISPTCRALEHTSNGYTSCHWSRGRPPTQLIPLSYLQPPPPSFPLQPFRTPTTRDSTAAMALPLSPFPTPPATPASSSMCHSNNHWTSTLLLPFPPPPPPATNCNTTTLLPISQPQTNSGTLQNYVVPFPISSSPLLEHTPSPTPSPPHILVRDVPMATHTTQQHSYTDIVSLSIFLNYLDDLWPEASLRRSSSIIRSSLYDKIVSVIQGGGEVKGRQRQWIKKSEFFLVEKDGRGLLLAIPVSRSRVSRRGTVDRGGGGGGGGKSECRRASSYRLVARLEDFYYIISSYHNNAVGHHGIRKTFAMIQEEYSYLPRTAVAKYIELCNICRVHRTGKPDNSLKRSKKDKDKTTTDETVISTQSTDSSSEPS